MSWPRTLISSPRQTVAGTQTHRRITIPTAWDSVTGFVLVVTADPELPSVVLGATLRRPVEEPVVGHQELDPATGCRVRLVDDVVLEREHGEAEQLGHVAVDVRARGLGVAVGDGRQLVENRLDARPRLLGVAREPRSALKSLS